VIEELVLVGEVRVERGPVYGRPLGDLLHREPGMALLRHELVERPHDEPTGALDAGINALLDRPAGSFNNISAPLLLRRHRAVLVG
jgi:hypothetical protein